MTTEAAVRHGRQPQISESKKVALLIPYDARVTGDQYAWGKTGHALCNEDYEAAWQNTKGNFITVDLCSSLPMLSQIWREEYRKHCRGEAMRIAGAYAQVLDVPHKSPFAKMNSIMSREVMVNVRKQLTQKKLLPRELLQAIIQDILYSPPRLKPDEDKKQQLKEYIIDLFSHSSHIYTYQFEREEMVGRGRWQIARPEGTFKTFASEVMKYMEEYGPRYGNEFLDITADFVAEHCLPLLRRFRAISVDCQDPDTLLQKAAASFPTDYWRTEFFRRMRHLPDNHTIADVTARLPQEEAVAKRRRGLPDQAGLPFIFNSVSYISCIEGWPFYFKHGSKKYQFDLAQSIAEVLKPGGRATFFPWGMNNQSERDRNTLKQIERMWQGMGLVVTKKRVRNSQLIEGMSDREVALTYLSPVFKNPEAAHWILRLEKLIELPQIT